MNPNGDNSPLWGASQLNYPNFNPPQILSGWIDTRNPEYQNGYNPYPTQGSYNNWQQPVEAMYNGYQQHPAGPSVTSNAFQQLPLSQHPYSIDILQPDSEHFPPTLNGRSELSSSSVGYSSPRSDKNVINEVIETMPALNLYATDNQQQQCQWQHLPQQQQQQQQLQQYAIFTDQKQNNNLQLGIQVQQCVDSKKPIIHENIVIKPANCSGPPQVKSIRIQQRNVPQQDEQQPGTSAQQQPQPHTQQTTGTTQCKPRRSLPQHPSCQTPSVETDSSYQCETCSEFFKRKCGLTQHKSWVHSERLFQCEQCGKKFLSEELLTVHIARHYQKSKVHKCPICPKRYVHKTDLNRHKLRHGPRLPYQCDQCPKGFARRDHLTGHQDTHRGRSKRKSRGKENESPM